MGASTFEEGSRSITIPLNTLEEYGIRTSVEKASIQTTIKLTCNESTETTRIMCKLLTEDNTEVARKEIRWQAIHVSIMLPAEIDYASNPLHIETIITNLSSYPINPKSMDYELQIGDNPKIISIILDGYEIGPFDRQTTIAGGDSFLLKLETYLSIAQVEALKGPKQLPFIFVIKNKDSIIK